MNHLKPNTLKFLKGRIASQTNGENNFRFDEGRALALAYLGSVVADHRVPGQAAFPGLEPCEPETPDFSCRDGIGAVGKDHHDERLVVVHDWTTLTALAFLREATSWFYQDNDDRLCEDLYRTLEAAREELGNPQTEETDFDFVAGPLELPVGECVFSDEYDTCHRCNTIIRTTAGKADHYVNGDSELICGECVRGSEEEIEAYLEYIAEFENRANTILTTEQLEAAGFKQIEADFENGWYGGQTDDPKNIMTAVQKALPDATFVFNIGSVGQFDVHFNLWVKGASDEQRETLAEVVFEAEPGADIAKQFEKAMKSVNFSKSDALIEYGKKHGITVHTVNMADATVSVREISPEEFVEYGINGPRPKRRGKLGKKNG